MKHKEYRFEIAISFAGDNKRDKVRDVAQLLRAKLGDGKVFFDEWFEVELAGPDAQTVLQNYYRNLTRLVVTCVCERYNEKPWTQEEWRAIQAFERDLRDAGTNNVKRMRFLPLRFGDGDIDGLFSTAIVPDMRNRKPQEIAELILKRLDLAKHESAELAVREPTIPVSSELANLAKAVEDCLSAVDHIKGEVQASSTEVRPILMPGSIDTFDKPVYSWDKNRKVDYIKQFSLGPAYSLDDIDQDVIDAICDSLTVHQFIDLASEINRLRQEADPELKPRQILIPAGALPNPDQGLVNYAYRLLGNVFVRGPRMIVALLLSLPMTIWSEHEDKLLALLKYLQTPRSAAEKH